MVSIHITIVMCKFPATFTCSNLTIETLEQGAEFVKT